MGGGEHSRERGVHQIGTQSQQLQLQILRMGFSYKR